MVDKKRKLPGLTTRKGGVVYKVKINGKVQAVNSDNNIVKVTGTRCQLKLAGLPQRVQSKEGKDLDKLSACGGERRALGKKLAKEAANAARQDMKQDFLAYKKLQVGMITKKEFNKLLSNKGVRRMRDINPRMMKEFKQNKEIAKEERANAKDQALLKKFKELKKNLQNAKAARILRRKRQNEKTNENLNRV